MRQRIIELNEHLGVQVNVMNRLRNVILFIVEGTSDQNALEPILDALIDDSRIMFTVVRGDATIGLSNSISFTSSNMKNRIKNIIDYFLNNNRGIKKEYIKKVVYITDTDGCFINDSNVYENINDITTRYENDGIYTNNVEFIIKRNHEKSKNLSMIHSVSNGIYGLPIETYYFSCNLDHVLHNIRNLKQALKEEYADNFADKYEGREEEFIGFLNDEKLYLDVE